MRKCQDWAHTHSNICANFTCFCQNKVWRNIFGSLIRQTGNLARHFRVSSSCKNKSWCVEQLFRFLPHVLKPEMQLSSVSKHTKHMPACSSHSWSFCSGCARLRSLPICHYWLLIQCRKLEVKRAEWQTGTISPKSPYSFSNYPPFQSSAWSNACTPQPLQFGSCSCPVGFQFQSPVYAQCVDMCSNCQLAPSTDTNSTEWFRLQSLEGTYIRMHVLWLQQPNSYRRYHCSPSNRWHGDCIQGETLVSRSTYTNNEASIHCGKQLLPF